MRVRLDAAGIGREEAVETNLPNVKERLLAACTTRPFSAVTSTTGTFHSFAAAASRSARTVAPASRYFGRKSRMLVEPSVFCDPYFFSSPGACTTFTSFQSASISSATIIAMVVRMPWPISERGQTIVTVPVGSSRT